MATQSQPEFIVEVPRIPPQSTEGIVISHPPQIALQRPPKEVLAEAAIAAKALRDVIEAKPNKVVINGKTYPTHEDWLTVARFYNITVASRSTNYVERGRARGYECHAEAIFAPTGIVIGAAQAECLDDEKMWRDKPLFQLRSMAQTRAQAKALRSILSWVVVLAGYAPTPAEEMIEQQNSGSGRAIASRMEYTPMHPDKVRNACFGIAGAPNMESLRGRYLAAIAEAKKGNDAAARDAFIAAKDERKAKLSAGGGQ
jgi:hypothetical protein